MNESETVPCQQTREVERDNREEGTSTRARGALTAINSDLYVKKRFSFRKTTVYEREVLKSKKNFRRRSCLTHTTGG